jgi:hypothetical protein
MIAHTWPSPARRDLREWIRNRFVEINSELEDLYWAQEERSSTQPGVELKTGLLQHGEALIGKLSADDLTGGDLEDRYISAPWAAIAPKHLDRVTASGPPLDVLIASLECPRDQRLAAPRRCADPLPRRPRSACRHEPLRDVSPQES